MVATPGQQETGETLLTEPVISLKRKMGKKVGTHNGSFHCDEVLGCFMIRLTKKFEEAEIIRSRDQKVLDTMDAVLDVGGIYDPATDRYDHHQRGFEQAFGHGFVTKLSSAGLVYKVCSSPNPKPSTTSLLLCINHISSMCYRNHQLRLTQRSPCSIMGKKS
jgi:hypothetical protein